MSFASSVAKKTAYSKAADEAEEDRRRVARELHDDIGQRLALLADDAARLRNDLKLTDEASRKRFDSLVQQACDLGEDLRRISHSLHPSILEDLGPVPAVRALIEEFTRHSGMPAHFVDSNIPNELPWALSIALYRISQEALRNVSKHAGPATVQVSLCADPEEIVLVVADSGIGFKSGQQSGLGLISMRERAAAVGGTLRIVSAPGKGTSIHVHLPLDPRHAE